MVAPVIEAEDNETAFAITTITLFGLVSIVVFPIIGTLLSMSETEFGVWAGTSIHATAQVMAAAFAYGPIAGDTAVIVKLVRVLLLAPIVVIIGALYAREKRRQDQAHVSKRAKLTTLFPPFIFGFVGLALATPSYSVVGRYCGHRPTRWSRNSSPQSATSSCPGNCASSTTSIW